MKHHFADLLDRNGDYWTIIPNIERYAYSADELIKDKDSVRVLTITKDDRAWKQVFDLQNLEELTLHEPSHEQMESINSLTHLKRLRITHARPKNIEFIGDLINLEEIVLEYVSGFSDLSPLNKLKKLKSLHFENLRRVSDYGGLRGSTSLRYLYINGTLDWNQPIDDFSFLKDLPNLEVFALGWISNKSEFPALAPLLKLKKLKKIKIGRSTFSTQEYALLETALPNVEGAISELFWDYAGWREFLGKRAGRVKIGVPGYEEKCNAFAETYSELKKQSEILKKKYL